MCQNNLENTPSHPPTHFAQPSYINNYAKPPHPPHSHSHLVKLPLPQLDPYCSMLQARINNKHPYLINVLSFQLLPQKHTLYPNSKELIDIVVNTDKTIPLAAHDWTKDNLVKILLALKRLTMIYGPFAVTLHQISKNEHQEIKVWISKNVEKCRVDASLGSQKDMLRQVAMLLQKKNSELAFRINAAHSIREAIDSLHSMFVYNSPQKQYKTMDWSELSLNKNIFSSCTTKLDLNKTYNSPTNKNLCYVQTHQFPRSAKHQVRDKMVFNKNYPIFNSNMVSRAQSKIGNHLGQQGLVRSEDYTLKNNSEVLNDNNRFYYIPNASHQPSRSNSRHLTFTPMHRFGNSSTGQHFSQRLGSQRLPQGQKQGNGRINNFDITIINNNYSNYVNNFAENRSRKGSKSPISKYPSFIHSKKQKAKSQDKTSKNSSFWMKSAKLSKNQSSAPHFFAQKHKPQSSHQQYTSQSLQESVPEFKRNNNADSIKVDSDNNEIQRVRKEKKLYTFFNPNYKKQNKQTVITPKGNQKESKFNFFKKMTPSNTFNRSNTTQFFPAKKDNLNNKSSHAWQDEGRQKRFNSFAVDIQHQQQVSSAIPTTKSVAIQQTSSVSSKKLQLKKQLKMQFGNLFNIAQANQSPRCSYQQTMSKNEIRPSESKTQLLKQSILKEKIKQKNEAFAQLKKQALKVLTDF